MSNAPKGVIEHGAEEIDRLASFKARDREHGGAPNPPDRLFEGEPAEER